jgi:hypothetical protein
MRILFSLEYFFQNRTEEIAIDDSPNQIKHKRDRWYSYLYKADPLNSLSLSSRIRLHFKGYFISILLVYLLAFFTSFTLVYFFQKANQEKHFSEHVGLFVTIFGFSSTVSSLLILWSSIRSEALAKQAYDFVSKTTKVNTFHYNSFSEHLEWVSEHLSHEKYPSRNIKICISISTPIYGLADSLESADIFLKFLESWTSHFENMHHTGSDMPEIELCFWKKEPHISTFCRKAIKIATNPESRKRFDQLSNILDRIYNLHKDSRISCRLFFSDETHTRWFFIKENSNIYAGLLVVFSPLTQSSILNKNWTLVGFNFSDKESYDNLTSFNLRLQHEDHSKGRENRVELLSDAKGFLKTHYDLK